MKRDYFRKDEGGEFRNGPVKKTRNNSRKRINPVVIFVAAVVVAALCLFLL